MWTASNVHSKIQTGDTKVLWSLDYLKLGETKAPISAVRRAQWPWGQAETGGQGGQEHLTLDAWCACLMTARRHTSDLGPCLDLARLQEAHVLTT